MRILVVSAHYPPNFVSGGTLQPQRIALELARRGHVVSVYAGWYGEGRPPLEAWSEEQADTTVRWVVTTPWTDWSDDANFDNPAVASDFAKVLDDVRPDVVHFHSIQSLGGGVVEAATERGIPTVVTMHDFWWSCGRQFLVNRSFHPCSLVVEAGVCECQSGRQWLLARNERLRRVVARVDAVLAPSAIAAAVLAANGVDQARLHFDENGIPDDGVLGHVGAEREERDSTLRFVYTGGPDPMKGADVLADAVTMLAGDPGWRLVTYGVESLAGPHVEPRPPFDPERLDDVLAAADVVLVPSVMRESYSLVTREALLRGVPVVCTDSLGPEEVVRHGVNGLIVPAADPGALAGAMRRLVREPGLVDRLRSRSTDVSVRTLTDQVDGLERRYRELGAGRSGGNGAPSVRRVLFAAGIDGAPLRYRVRLPAEALALLGVESAALHYRDPRVRELAGRADAVVLYRVPATVQILDLVAELHRRKIPVVFDVDDLIFDPDLAADIPALRILPPEEADLWMEGVRRYRTTLEACDLFVGSTAALCDRVAALTGLPIERFDNGVGIALGQLSDAALARRRTAGPLRIAYLSGTDTHEEDWAYVEPAVIDVLDRHSDVELWLAGKVTPSPALDRLGTRVRRIPFTAWVDLPSLLHDIDVNLAPLAPGSLFNEAKSAIKWLEAALVETPSIVSPTTPFREAVEDGVNGMLAADLDGWSTALDALLGDEATRQRVGRRARRDALLRWSPHLQGRRYLAILERAAYLGATDRRSAFDAVALDEPAFDRPSPLEPYDPAEWRRWTRRRRIAPADPRRLASAARAAAARARARLTRSTD